MESLKEKTAKGLFWGGMNNGVQQLLGLAFGIILGRLLDPSDYGMTAMLAVFSVIANELQSSGFKTGLINLREPKHEDYNAVFWFNIVAGVVLYVVLWFAAPLIADYYHEPKLIPLSRYVFLGFVFSSFGMAQSAYLTKQMQIKQIAKCGMTATLSSSLVSVAMAAMGFGYWALATQYLMYIAVNTMLLWYFSPWRPSLSRNEEGGMRKENSLEADQTTPNRRLLHEDAIAYSGGGNTLQGNLFPLSTFLIPLKRLFPFSFRIMLSAIFTQLFLLVGNMLRQVDQTVLVGLRDERERQLAVLRKMMRFTAFISFPLLFCLAMVSHEFIVLAIGEKWAFAASLLPLLCLSGAFMPLSTLLTDSVISQHRSDIYLWSTVALGVLQIAMMVSLWRQGIVVMVWAYTLLNIVWVFVWHFFVRRLMGYGLLAFLKDIVPFALAAAGVMIITHFSTQAISVLWLKLLCRVAIATLLYYVVMRIAGAVILKEVIGFFKKN